MNATHKEYADGLRAVADFYESHPEIPLPYDTDISNGSVDTKEEAATIMRALGSCSKNYSDYYFVLAKNFGPIKMQFIFTRHKVCVRKVIGVETIEAEFVPAHTIPAWTKEIVEWECEAILEPANAAD